MGTSMEMCDARIGEVFKIRAKDIDSRKILVRNLKSRKEEETHAGRTPFTVNDLGFIILKGRDLGGLTG